MEWKQKYCVGIKQIDDQHKSLVDMITRLQEIANERDSITEMRNVIKDIVKYTKFHFSEEEKFMNKIGFPERVYHKDLHDGLIRQVIELLQGLKFGRQLSSIDLIDFLKDWLINHIIKEDIKIGNYYNHEYRQE